MVNHIADAVHAFGYALKQQLAQVCVNSSDPYCNEMHPERIDRERLRANLLASEFFGVAEFHLHTILQV